MYLLDTNICIYAIKNRSESVIQKVNHICLIRLKYLP